MGRSAVLPFADGHVHLILRALSYLIGGDNIENQSFHNWASEDTMDEPEPMEDEQQADVVSDDDIGHRIWRLESIIRALQVVIGKAKKRD